MLADHDRTNLQKTENERVGKIQPKTSLICVCDFGEKKNLLRVFAESGVGAGIDSYYEYLLKAYILLGDETYLDRFNKVSSPFPCCREESIFHLNFPNRVLHS